MRVGATTIAAVVCAIAAVGPSFAIAKLDRLPAVKVDRWTVTSHSGTTDSGAPGSKISHCTLDDKAISLRADSRVEHAIEGERFKEIFSRDNKVRAVFQDEWSADGAGPLDIGLSVKGGLPDGVWKIEIRQGGKAIGRSSVTVKSDPSC